MFNYIFHPSDGAITGNGTRTRRVHFITAPIDLVDRVSFIYSADDSLKVIIELSTYEFSGVRREDLAKTLEAVVNMSDEELKPYRISILKRGRGKSGLGIINKKW